jgi:hypothetical protein
LENDSLNIVLVCQPRIASQPEATTACQDLVQDMCPQVMSEA